ncbi:Aste57867_8891 [Aphanomyces stellatus]|uniref:Aste57867_8891 protein n=1 Tax=Aphanomyces stellatus TaxID=120398 RepID=A0A485KLD7_9STRA|nr:hypothetical protein As57867_008856 [Aphanomyces stellatus]VFT85775.1 Aste57867_8891 [Aphanomyces stellatus]
MPASKFDQVRATCLDSDWVDSVAAALAAAPPYLDPFRRDAQLRRVHPWLQPALQMGRFSFTDPRQRPPKTASVQPFSPTCLGLQGEVLHGVGETVNAATGQQIKPGIFKGTVTFEWDDWASQWVSTWVAAIVVQEVIGFDVSFLETSDTDNVAERLSSTGRGRCAPVHFNAEVWGSRHQHQVTEYASEVHVDTNGYSGLYVGLVYAYSQRQRRVGGTKLTPRQARHSLDGGERSNLLGTFSRPLSADLWHEYVRTTDLATFYAHTNVSAFANASVCPDGALGCLNGCVKSHACSVAETQGNSCVLVAMMGPTDDPGFLPAVLSTLNIPATFCFSGYDGVNRGVESALATDGAITFYHYEPDLFHLKHRGALARIALPHGQLMASTTNNSGTFGETGYVTTNPVRVDFAPERLAKYYSDALVGEPLLATFATKFTLTDVDIDTMLSQLNDLNDDMTVDNAPFAAACAWVKANYMTWQHWVPRLPLCTFADGFMLYDIDHTSSNTTRTISFFWSVPDELDMSKPSLCDGGLTTVPPPLVSSRSFEWLNDPANFNAWSAWITTLPFCDETFYNYTVSSCDDHATRTATFFWLLPQANDSTMSRECVAGVALPPTTLFDCDYVPPASSTATAVHGGALAVIVVLAVGQVGLVVFRDKPAIKRSQWPLLFAMLVGGILFCIFVLLGAGPPSWSLCALRPITLSLGYTLVFGSLLVKGLRVHWVFATKSLKKVTVPLAKIVKMLLVLLAVDAVLLTVWLVSDFPTPTTTSSRAVQFPGTVDHITCHSSSFLFSALLLFWKAIVTLGGMYVSFLIRHAGSDFQESIWIFGSTCVVSFGAIVLLPLAYAVKLPPLTNYALESTIVLIATVAVMGLMLLPKLHRLHAQEHTGKSSTAGPKKSTNTQHTTHGSTASTSRVMHVMKDHLLHHKQVGPA